MSVEFNENKYVSFEIVKKPSLGIIKAKSSYIPIEEFKSSFMSIAKIVENSDVRAIVFDKQKLDTFHQPSMEWYYIEWKKELAEYGITKHYKILPQDDFFKMSVDAGKKEIKEKYPDFDFSKFEVIYVNSVDEIVEKEKLEK